VFHLTVTDAIRRACYSNFRRTFFRRRHISRPIFTITFLKCLLPQVEMIMNLLCTPRQHPQLSAAAHFHHMIDYNKTAFSPLGCKIIAHEKPSQRRTWAPHGKHGYSLGP
jgi:hypothetical protein